MVPLFQRPRALALSLGYLLLAIAGILASGERPWLRVASVLLAFISLVSLISACSGYKLRIDWFLPFLRKRKSTETAPNTSRLSQVMRRMIPSAWLSDLERGRPGRIRRVLKRLGPSVVSSPFRRVVQAICFGLFLYLFLYVCWPYSATPAPSGRSWQQCRLVELDESGRLRFSGLADAAAIQRDQPLFLLTAGEPDGTAGRSYSLQLEQVEGEEVWLVPERNLPVEVIDQLLTSNQVWQLSESDPNQWPDHYTAELQNKEWVPAELFLILDPLVSISTALAARSWVWSLGAAGLILIICVLVPRGFCGYLCPLGTLIDLVDWIVWGRIKRFRVPDNGWWVHIKYYLLIGSLVAGFCGVLISGYVAAIPVITRGMLFLLEPAQSAALRGTHLVPAFNMGHLFSLVLFAAVLSLGLLRPRFWCKYVCPSGAVFSIGNLFRVTERKVESSCIHCNKCVEICPFDAIKPDFTTRVTDCTMCQTCGGVCPTHAIKFVDRWNVVELKVLNDPPTNDTALGRRGFLSLAAGTAAAAAGGVVAATGTRASNAADDWLAVRPPGSVPEPEFLQMCIRCGECFKACPNNVLQPEAFQQGLEGLWTPLVQADWAGCESSCNACGQVCPTGAIRPLPLEEKRHARMGLAIVNEQTCLPYAGKEACQLCVDECKAAGYDAIEFMQVHTAVDDQGEPVPGSGYLAPVVLEDLCVGCGLCQTRCYAINVKERQVLSKSAIIIEAGEGKEDRLMTGSYIDRFESRQQHSTAPANPAQVDQLPNASGTTESDAKIDTSENPF